MAMSNTYTNCFPKIIFVVFAFCSALILGAIKAVLVGPIAGLILIIGNVGVILGLFPAHFSWTLYTVVKTNRYDAPLKVALLIALPVVSGIWLALSIGGSVLVGVGYGFFAPWVSTFEAFRHHECAESKKFVHCLVDGTWGTVKGSCTVVRDFTDLCYHSYPVCLKELREAPASNGFRPLRFVHVPACIIVGILGLIVEIPLYTAIALVKSPYMLFKGWQRLSHDLISREGPFLETACVPIAGLTILFWPLIVIGSVIMAIFSSFFIALYGSVVVYQERSFRRGVAYVIAMVGAFDEYTNDWLYLREGTIFPKPQYRKKMKFQSSELSVGGSLKTGGKTTSVSSNEAPPAMLVPNLAHSRSVRETIQEVKMVQIWGNMMRSCEQRGKELLDENIITPTDLYEWLKTKETSLEASMISAGLPCYSFLQTLLHSIKAGSAGLLLLDGVEVTNMNRPQDKLIDWFFSPIMVLKEQIRALQLTEGETKYLEKVTLLGSSTQRMDSWDNGSFVPRDALRAAQIQGISRRMVGIVRSVSKLPTYRRRFRHVVKGLIAYSMENESSTRSDSIRSYTSVEVV